MNPFLAATPALFLALALSTLPAPADPHGNSNDNHLHIGHGHIDLTFCLENGSWKTGLVWDGTPHPLDPKPAVGTLRSPLSATILAKDQPFSTGNRVRRPADPAWNFTGVGPGDPFWWFPQASTPESPWTGFSSCSAACASYRESDPRINATATWTTISLTSVRYVGKGSGHFFMWSSGTFGEIIPWMSSADGITPDDRYFIGNSGHAHPAMGFSSLGLYEISFTSTCYTGPGKTNPNSSPPVSFYFAVGTYWEWISRNFSPARWFSDNSAAALSDPDNDRIPNLMEFSCGLNPRSPDVSYSQGSGLPGLPALIDSGAQPLLRFAMRDPASNPQVELAVRPIDHLTTPLTLEPRLLEGIPGWFEAVCPLPLSSPSRFFRLEATLLPEISYSD